MEGGDGVGRLRTLKTCAAAEQALDKLYDRVVDRQLDSKRVQKAMASIVAPIEVDIPAARLSWRRKWLIVTLREHKGDAAVVAIRSLLYQHPF